MRPRASRAKWRSDRRGQQRGGGGAASHLDCAEEGKWQSHCGTAESSTAEGSGGAAAIGALISSEEGIINVYAAEAAPLREPESDGEAAGTGVVISSAAYVNVYVAEEAHEFQPVHEPPPQSTAPIEDAGEVEATSSIDSESMDQQVAEEGPSHEEYARTHGQEPPEEVASGVAHSVHSAGDSSDEQSSPSHHDSEGAPGALDAGEISEVVNESIAEGFRLVREGRRVRRRERARGASSSSADASPAANDRLTDAHLSLLRDEMAQGRRRLRGLRQDGTDAEAETLSQIIAMFDSIIQHELQARRRLEHHHLQGGNHARGYNAHVGAGKPRLKKPPPRARPRSGPGNSSGPWGWGTPDSEKAPIHSVIG